MAKVIEIDAQERRRDRRREIMLDGRLDGRSVVVVDVSFGGMSGAIEFQGKCDWLPEVGTEASLDLLTPSGRTHSFIVEILRANGLDGQFGAKFVRIDDAQFRLIERLMMGRPV